MNTSVHLKLSKAEFFKFVASQAEGRLEYEDGRIVQQMTGGTRRHSVIAQRFVSSLEQQLAAASWLVTSHSRGVDVGTRVRYPDVVIEPAKGAWSDLATEKPMVLVEVPSPTTEALDLGIKPAEYTGLTGLQAYIVARQDRVECLIWQRGQRGRFPESPELVRGRRSRIEIKWQGLVVPMATIYRGIKV
jgi:Uma2 family endonuclease